MILGVAAAVYAFERREIIRQTWGTYANTEDVKLLFFVGDNGDANVNEHLIKGKTSPQSYSDRVFRSKRKPGHHPGELRREPCLLHGVRPGRPSPGREFNAREDEAGGQ